MYIPGSLLELRYCKHDNTRNYNCDIGEKETVYDIYT